jgi:hypothetical protein
MPSNIHANITQLFSRLQFCFKKLRALARQIATRMSMFNGSITFRLEIILWLKLIFADSEIYLLTNSNKAVVHPWTTSMTTKMNTAVPPENWAASSIDLFRTHVHKIFETILWYGMFIAKPPFVELLYSLHVAPVLQKSHGAGFFRNEHSQSTNVELNNCTTRNRE